MPQRPPDVTPEILTGDLSEERLSAYLASREVAVAGLSPAAVGNARAARENDPMARKSRRCMSPMLSSP